MDRKGSPVVSRGRKRADSKARTPASPRADAPLTPAKVARPRLPHRVYERQDAFALLDRASGEHGICWVEGLPGSGKTTATLSWLAARERPSVWFQVDAGDNDIPTFFHYLGLAIRHAAPRFRRPLPHLTPEYLGGVETFSRRFLEECARRLPGGTVLVLDNFQEAGDGPLAELLGATLDGLATTHTVICLSRFGPPPAFARLRANGMLSPLDREALRLSLEEAQGIAALRGVERGMAAAIHDHVQGWMAGLILMLEQPGDAGLSATDGHDPQAVFDYFAGEVLRRLDAPDRDVLLAGALLPKMSAADIDGLTGRAGSAALLEDLVRRNYFTYRLSPRTPVFEYHPLFRAFLLSQLRASVPADALAVLCTAAAQRLEAGGQLEAAAELWLESGEWDAVARLVCANAGRLLSEGRTRQLESWLQALPGAVRESDGWLQYWSGNCRLAFDPCQARRCFEQAYALFRQAGEVAGQYLAWAGVVDTFMYEWGDFGPLDRWVAELEALRAAHPRYPSPEIEARVTMGMLGALTWRFPGHPALPGWAEQAMRLVVASAGSRLAMMIGNHLVFYSLWDGEFPKAAAVIEVLRPHARRLRDDPLALLHWYVMEAMYSWFAADHDACMAAIEAGNRLAADTGVRLLDIYLNAQGVYSAVSIGDRTTARECVQRIVAARPTRMLDKSLCHYMLASVAWLEEDYPRAIAHSEAAVQLAEATNSTLGLGLCEVEYAMTLAEVGRSEEATVYLARARASNRGRQFMEFLDDLHGAWFALVQGDSEQLLERLGSALRVGARQGYVNIPRWQSPVMARLCAVALSRDLESAYVVRLIASRGLLPPAEDEADADAWPWPVRIHALGSFTLTVNDAPLQLSAKTQRKPLELLKALVAQGGREAPLDAVTGALWPDADGDAAHQSLKTTVHRLRKLLGVESAVRVQGGKISLSRQHCWVDAWALEKRLAELDAAQKTGSYDASTFSERLEPLWSRYTGPFLGDETNCGWELAYRDRLHRRLVRLVETAGIQCEAAGDRQQAIAWDLRGLDIEPLDEAFYRRLMNAYHADGRSAEATAVYRRCQAVLEQSLGMEMPSAPMQADYERIRREAGIAPATDKPQA